MLEARDFIKSEKFMKLLKVFLIPLSLSIFFFIIALASIQEKSTTVDEKFHLIRGVVLLETGDYRINSHHPILSNILTALPTLFDEDLVIPELSGENWDQARKDELSFELVKENGGKIEFTKNVLPGPRAVMIIISTLFIGIYYTVIRKLFNFKIAFISSLLLAISPTFIAHGRLVTTDVPAMITIFLATISLFYYISLSKYNAVDTKKVFWKFSKKDLALIVFVLLGSVALLTKYTTVTVAPLWMVFLWLHIFSQNKDTSLIKRIIVPTLVVLGVVFSWVLILTAAYGFQFNTIEAMMYGHPGKIQSNAGIHEIIDNNLGKDGFLTSIWGYLYYEIKWPFPQYIYGFYDNVFLHDYYGHMSFLMGEFSNQGWFYYFPLSFLIKEPITLIVLTFTSFGFSIYYIFNKMKINLKAKKSLFKVIKLEYLLLISVPSFILLLSTQTSLNLGIRHLLPLYPFLFLFIGWASSELLKMKDAYKYFLIVLFVFMYTSVLSQYPNYISYFNESVGGPSEGYKYLRSSNLDWEQNDLLVDTYIKERTDEEYVRKNGMIDISVWHASEDHLIIRKVTLFNPSEQGRLPLVEYLYHGHEDGSLIPIEEIGNTHLVFEVDDLMKEYLEK